MLVTISMNASSSCARTLADLLVAESKPHPLQDFRLPRVQRRLQRTGEPAHPFHMEEKLGIVHDCPISTAAADKHER